MKLKLSDGKRLILMYLFLPVILDLIIECLNRKSIVGGIAYMFSRPSLFVFNVLIIMLTLSIAMFFTREIFVYTTLALLWIIFGIANFVILHFRVTPFSAVDFTLIKSAISVSGHYLNWLNIAMIVMGAVMLVVAVVLLFIKAPTVPKEHNRRGYVVSAAIVLTLMGSIIFIRKSSTSVQALAKNYTNISEAYENYGFVYCFTNSIIDTGIKKPEDYSKKSVKKITKKLKEKQSNPSEKPNVIMIQLESFFDVNNVKGLSFSSDPLPNFHKLQNKYSNGYLTVPTVGAGTVNTEFEVLTGMSQHDFGVSEYPYKTVLKNTPVESICRDLSEIGYTSHCVHNNTATFYGRNTVFTNIGFHDFTSVEYMNNITLNPNGWANDDVMTNEILKTLDSTSGSDFTFGITVQSHGKYDGVTNTGSQKIRVSGAPVGKENAYNYYVNEIYEVDQMIGRLIAELSRRDEKTVLVLYGDHLPSLDLTKDDLKNKSLYQTEYVVWDNMGLDKQDVNLEAYQLYSNVLNRIGIHQGTITKYHQQTDWSSKKYLSGLKTLEYDTLYGDNYMYNGTNPYEPTALQMGVDTIKITNVKRNKMGYLVTGNGFTPYCHIYFNGSELDSTWVDEHHMQVTDEIEVAEEKEEDAQTAEEDENSTMPAATTDPDDIVNAFIVKVENGDGVDLSYSAPYYLKRKIGKSTD